MIALLPRMAEGILIFNSNTTIPNGFDVREFHYEKAKEKSIREKYLELNSIVLACMQVP